MTVQFVVGLLVGGAASLFLRSGFKSMTRSWHRVTRSIRRFTHGVYAWVATVGFVGLMVVVAWRTGA